MSPAQIQMIDDENLLCDIVMRLYDRILTYEVSGKPATALRKRAEVVQSRIDLLYNKKKEEEL